MASVRQPGTAPPRPTALCHVSGGWGICFRDLSRNLHPCSHSLNRAAGDGVSVLSFPLCTATMWWHWTPWDTQNRQELRGPLTLSRRPYKNWLWVMNLHRIPLRLRGCSSETIWWANLPWVLHTAASVFPRTAPWQFIIFSTDWDSSKFNNLNMTTSSCLAALLSLSLSSTALSVHFRNKNI